MFELKILTNFAAAHQLSMVTKRCENLHGHNWKVEVCIIGKKLDKSGVLIDFGIVKNYLAGIIREIDHKFLNDLNLEYFDNINPSSENIGIYIAEQMKKKIDEKEIKIKKVVVWESDNACAVYYPINN